MQKILSSLIIAALLSYSVAFASSTPAPAKVTIIEPAEALHMLMEGNEKFAKNGNTAELKKEATVKTRQEVALGQHPFAIVITCSDSRLPPEIIFNQGLGEIFVVRVAGNIVAPHELGSIEYAIEHLGARLVMVLGHERCGAVTATYEAHEAGVHVEGNIGSLVESIEPAVVSALAHGASGTKGEIVEECIVENIKLVSEQIEAQSPIVKEFIEKGEVKIVKAKYDLDDGIVTLIK